MKEQYYGDYLARSVMFANEINGLLAQLEKKLPILDINVSDLLKVMFETFMLYANEGFVSGKAKSNIYFFLDFIRKAKFNCDIREVFNNYQNTILEMLNGESSDSRLSDFYRQELFIRRNSKMYLNPIAVSNKKVLSLAPAINDGILFDCDVLFSHLEENDSAFENQQIQYVASRDYVGSVRHILYKYPTIMSNPNFKNSVCSTLDRRTELNRQYRKGIFKRFSLDKTNRYTASISYSRENKKLLKQVIGKLNETK